MHATGLSAVASVARGAGLLNGRCCLEWDHTVADGRGGNARISADPIHSVALLAGLRVTLSGTIKCAAGISQLAPRVVQSFGQGASAAVQTNFPVIPVTTSAARFEAALDVPSNAGKTILGNGDDFSEVQFLRAAAPPPSSRNSGRDAPRLPALPSQELQCRYGAGAECWRRHGRIALSGNAGGGRPEQAWLGALRRGDAHRGSTTPPRRTRRRAT